MLVEADGARGRSLKAPAAHEPAIPSFANQVVVLCAIDAVGAPMGETRSIVQNWLVPFSGSNQARRLPPVPIVRLLGDVRAGHEIDPTRELHYAAW